MKLKKLLLFVLLISIVLICSFKGRIIKASEIDSEKVYCTATIEDEFTDNEIFITIKNTESLDFNEYTISDFSEINCISIEDLTDGYKDKIIEQLNGTYTGNMPVNLETFNRILKLTLNVNSKQYVLDSIKKLEELDYIKSAEPNYIMETENLGTPNDFYYNNSLDGTSSEWVYESMNMEEAWDYVDSIDVKENILVGVYDTGVNGDHEDLCYKNELDDITSSVFSINGKNLGTNQGTCLTDEDGHGTRVAGIIAAYRNNERGISGVCGNAQIVSLRDVATSIESFIECIEYADENNVRIINCSRGDYQYNSTLKTAIMNYSGLMVCAAGNAGNDNDGSLSAYPASYDLDNIISVGAIDDNLEQWVGDDFSSNYGQTSVDLFAPGKNIVSTYKDGGYNIDSGTSFAAPFVTGVAALILSIEPNLTVLELKGTILLNVISISSLSNKCVTGGILNAESAVKNIHSHSYTYTYDTALYHHGECACGAVAIQPHTWKKIALNMKSCIGCGETIFVVNNIKKEDEYEY